MSRIIRRVRQAGVYFVTTDTWERRVLFRKSELAQTIVDQLLACRDRAYYRLHAFALMPDHLHILLTPGDTASIERAIQMIKGGSAHRVRLKRPQKFPVWHAGFHDRWIRNATEYFDAKRYIEMNPVEAGLVSRPEEFAFSSANPTFRMDFSRFEEPGAKALGEPS